MSSDDPTCFPAPRQYRPTYSFLPSSTSMSNFRAPAHVVTRKPSSIYKRRRTTANFPSAEHLHSEPTVASSDLTASVSSYDISKPTSKSHRLSVQPRTRTPSRIPTPMFGAKTSSQNRAFSSPAAIPKLKENILPTPHRLLGPIPPGPLPNQSMTRSRTMNVLSNLTSSFARSTHNLTSSRASSTNLSNHSTTTPDPNPSSPAFTPNIRQITTTMPPQYWLGRYLSLHDRFRSDDLLSTSLSSPTFFQNYNITLQDTSPASPPDANDSAYHANEERLAKQVFVHLDDLSVTHEARKSLRSFQQAYARKVASEALLPLGGTMTERETGGFIAKAGRLFSGGSGGGAGRKSSFGAGMGRRRSLLGLGGGGTDGRE